MSEQQPWEQIPGESALWFGRFERYRLMWPHSIPEVYRDEWRAERAKKLAREETGGNRRVDPTLEADLPKEAPGSWYDAAKQFRWEERAGAWDKHQITLVEQNIAAERALVLGTGHALMHQRVATLKALAEQLYAMTKDPAKVWVHDVKAIGNGPDAERVDLVQFNSALYHELRATLDDLAKEQGERTKKTTLDIQASTDIDAIRALLAQRLDALANRKEVEP